MNNYDLTQKIINKKNNDSWWLLIFIVIITYWRFTVLKSMDLSLYVDEAQYWYWSQHLDFGYYSKPPMVALLIALTTSLFGDSEFFVRLASLIMYPLSSIVIYLIGERLFNSRVGLASTIVFLSMPAVSLSSLIISTDVAFFFFWALALYFLIRAQENNSWIWWISLGVAGGFGMETKYTMGVFVISAIAYFLASLRWRVFLNGRLWCSGIVAALIWLPNLVWNYQHDFITFQHTYDISQSSQQSLRWDEVFAFIGGQFGVFGIISFASFLFLTFRVSFENKLFLMIFSWVFIIIISYQAFFDGANANWAAPAFVTASIALGACIVKGNYWKLLVSTLCLNLFLASLIYYFEPLTSLFDIQITKQNDIYKRLRGWPELGKQFSSIRKQYPDAVLLGEGSRTELAHLAYHARPIKVSTWNESGNIRHHYDINNRLSSLSEKDFLYVSQAPLRLEVMNTFKSSQQVGKLARYLFQNDKTDYYVYLLSEFRGYER